MWFRRDLRLGDNPALVEASADGPVLPLFVLDPALWGPAGPSRRAYLRASLTDLDGQLRRRGTRLSVVRGDPVRRVVRAARAVGAERVHVAADFGPYGARRDHAVEEALAGEGIELVRTGSPYAVAPGRVRTGSGAPYKVFTPFSKAWGEHGWRGPVDPPSSGSWVELDEDTAEIPEPTIPDGLELPEAGEAAALRRWREFLPRVGDYDEVRDDPGRRRHQVGLLPLYANCGYFHWSGDSGPRLSGLHELTDFVPPPPTRGLHHGKQASGVTPLTRSQPTPPRAPAPARTPARRTTA